MYTISTIKSKFLSVLSIAALLINQLFWVTPALAQEATPSAEPITISESTSTPVVDENLTVPPSSPSATINLEIPEEETSAEVTPEIWQTNPDGSVTTTSPVMLNQTYVAPQNDKVTLTFTKLPENPGTLTIKQIILSQEDKEDLGAFSDIAYDITSTMENGTFEYVLTLPAPKTEGIEVKASEDGETFVILGGVTAQDDKVTITGLDHFTFFVVVGSIDDENEVTPFPDESNANVVINEFVFDSETEWVEIFNRGNSGVDLSGWMLEDGNNLTSDDLDLSGTLPPAGIFVFQRSSGWLNNTGDTIRLKDDEGNIISQVTYKKSNSIIVNAQDLGVNSIDDDESIARTEDGGQNWEVVEEPTKGYNNSGSLTFITVGEDFPYNEIEDAIDGIEVGGTIHVLEGNYEENLEIVQSLTLLGNLGNDSAGPAEDAPTIIGDCGATISIMAGNVTVSGFNIINGCGQDNVYIGSNLDNITIADNSISEGDNGVYINDSTNTTVQRNVIEENSYGIYLTGNVSGTQILNNQINENGEGISGGGGVSFDEFTISNNRIKNNEGYGIYFNGFSGSEEERSELIISNNIITGNEDTSVYLSGDIFVDEGSITYGEVTISGNTISENEGDGIYADVIISSTFTVSNNTIGEDEDLEIEGNSGSGIYICAEGECENSTITITNNNIAGNGSDGINFNEILENSEVTISANNSILNNSGRGIYIWMVDENSEVEINGNTISDNDETGIYLDEEVQRVSITDNTISGNGGGDTGILVEQANGNSAHLNKITGNGVGVQNNDDETFDAIENWWGSTAGPEGEGADSVSGNVLFDPWCFDEDCDHVFSNPPEGSLLANVSYGLPPGATLSGTPSLTFFEEEIYTINHDAGGSSTVTIPTGVVITRSNNEDFDASELTSDDVTVSLLAGLDTGVVADGALQWGLPNIELTFTSAITLNIFVGIALNGQVLNIQRSTSVTGGWTNDGIGPPTTCTVAAGLCTFTATKASNYIATHTTSTSSSSSSSDGSSPLTAASAPSCDDVKPGSPTLISAIGGVNNVTLTWNKALNPVSYYLVTYGSGPGLQQYGNPNVGGPDTTSYTVSGLSGGTAYFFKVRAGNNCAPGDFSNELSATPTGGVVSGSAAGFSEGVLGASTEEESVTEEEGESEVKGESSENQAGPQSAETAVNKGTVGSIKDNWIWLVIALLAIPTVLYLVRRR